MLSSVCCVDFDKCESKIIRDTYTDVNRLATKPMVKEIANPLIGPVPNRNKKIADTTVVTDRKSVV